MFCLKNLIEYIGILLYGDRIVDCVNAIIKVVTSIIEVPTED